MITATVLAAVLAIDQSSPKLVDSQVRPGTFSGTKTDPAKLTEMDAIERARVSARELDREGRTAEALTVLLTWRHKAATAEGMSLYYPTLRAYVKVGDWKAYLDLTEEKYDNLSRSKSTSVTAEDVLRFATALFIAGKKQASWELCQAHTDLFNENFLSNNLKKYHDKPIARANLGDALLRASAQVEGADVSMYFFGLLIKESPNDADAYHLLARSLPSDDLLSKKIHMLRAYELAEGEVKKQYKRYLDDLTTMLKMREKRIRGAGGGGISLGG